jgi:hypothetical protein
MGRIEKGDYAAFLDLYRKNHRALDAVYLASPGGDAEEAMLIGWLLRKYLLTAKAPVRLSSGGYLRAPLDADDGDQTIYGEPSKAQELCSGPGCVCASACALIWFGAVERSGTIGLHRPVISDPSFQGMPPDQASKVYRQVLDDIRRYLAEMEAPPVLIEKMIATDSSEIEWSDRYDDYPREPPSIAEWINSSCGSFTPGEEVTTADLSLRKHGFYGPPLNAREDERWRELTKRSDKRLDCSRKLRRVHVDALGPP